MRKLTVENQENVMPITAFNMIAGNGTTFNNHVAKVCEHFCVVNTYNEEPCTIGSKNDNYYIVIEEATEQEVKDFEAALISAANDSKETELSDLDKAKNALDEWEKWGKQMTLQVETLTGQLTSRDVLIEQLNDQIAALNKENALLKDGILKAD